MNFIDIKELHPICLMMLGTFCEHFFTISTKNLTYIVTYPVEMSDQKVNYIQLNQSVTLFLMLD